ncbi:hypothetical protein DHX103_06455 [Planococcus sp. X10-3]|uniref:hypothetical protein n=1 Tax=Planococcus sp. X10-3 TaxID=3061240 RepID=UPI003BB0911F
MKKKLHLTILLSIAIYLAGRLAMLFFMADKNYLFIYKNYDPDLLLPYVDVGLTLLFFYSLYNFFKNSRAMRYISIALMTFFIPFTILTSFLYIMMNTNDEHSRHYFNTAAANEELLVVIGQMKGLHPDSGDPRDIYLYEKIAPFVYNKLAKSQIGLKGEELRNLSDMRVDTEELSVEINERRIFLEKDE